MSTSENGNFIKTYQAEYSGGHPQYPTSNYCYCKLYENRLEICYWNRDTQYYEESPSIVIPYDHIINIENADKDKISAYRVAMLGIVGALWKKKHIYTIIQYKEEKGERSVIIDFGKDINEVQPFIYKKMLESKKDIN
jgi:hypothetical protein